MKSLVLLSLLPAVLAIAPKDGKTGRLPALGFNSWNAFRCDIHEDKFLVAAQEMVDTGLLAAGYNYVNIDDCWSLKARDNATGRIVPDPSRFPDGIKGTADKIHALGLKLGIYSDAGDATCAGYPGSLGHEATDAASFAEWGVDYLKYDNCNVPTNWTDEYSYWPENWFGGGDAENQTSPAPAGYDWGTSLSFTRYERMADALSAQHRTLLYSLCSWGHSHVEEWAGRIGQSWRMWGDIWPAWTGKYDYSWGFMPILNHALFVIDHTTFYAHTDLDMLEVGNGNLTAAETRSHFGLWAALKSPLLIGTPLDAISQSDLNVLKNWELLAYNQDPVYSAPARPYKWGINPDWSWNQTHPAEFYSGQSERGIHVFLLNTLDGVTKKSVVFSEVPGLSRDATTTTTTYEVRDMWTHKKLGTFRRKMTIELEAHDTAALLFTLKGGKHPHKDVLPLPPVYNRKPKRWGAG